MSDSGELWPLASAVARLNRMAELLPLFHQRAVIAANGHSTVLLRVNPRTDLLQPDSASGLDVLDPDPWLQGEAERQLAARAWADRQLLYLSGPGELGRRLQAQHVVVAPLQTRDQRLGLLVIGTNDLETAKAQREELTALSDLLSLALERARFHRQVDLQQDLRELSANLTKAVSSSAHLGATLEIFCDRAARLFAADRVSVWFHDRRAHMLELVASSDVAELAAAQRVAADDPSIRVAAAMRQEDVQVFAHPDERAPDVIAPLRGHRRALGALELHRVRLESCDAIDMLDHVEEVARYLSSAVENVLLLQSVLRSRRELESTFNSLTDLVVVTDRHLRITHGNRAFADRVQRPVNDLQDQPLSDFLGREFVGWMKQLQASRGAAESSERSMNDEKLGGSFAFTVSPLVGTDEERIGTVVVARDLTAQARLAAEGAELRSRLSQSEKLAALGQFVAGIAHEMNNPLQGVLGHLELLLQDGTLGHQVRRDLRLVFREADRAAKIVHNLLVFAGSRRIKRRRLNVNHVVSEVLGLRRTALAAAAIAIQKQLTIGLPRVAGDALLLQQALLNIVLNAEQAMAGSTTRVLEVCTRPVSDDSVEITIGDTGSGIPSDALSRLFEPFFTTKEVGKGTGLGLAITYGIVQEHGGRISARNRHDGDGAIFTMTLPATPREAVE